MTDRRVMYTTATNRGHIAEQIRALPDGWRVEAKPASRTLDQNAKLHAMFGDLEKKAKHLGRQLTAVQWKTLLISGHAIATGLGVEMVPGIEGEFVNIRESSAQMSKARMASLIEYITAWAADQGIEFNE